MSYVLPEKVLWQPGVMADSIDLGKWGKIPVVVDPDMPDGEFKLVSKRTNPMATGLTTQWLPQEGIYSSSSGAATLMMAGEVRPEVIREFKSLVSSLQDKIELVNEYRVRGDLNTTLCEILDIIPSLVPEWSEEP